MSVVLCRKSFLPYSDSLFELFELGFSKAYVRSDLDQLMTRSCWNVSSDHSRMVPSKLPE